MNVQKVPRIRMSKPKKKKFGLKKFNPKGMPGQEKNPLAGLKMR
jgi:hypothetical protein